MAKLLKKYSSFSKEQLISKIEKLEKEKYGLVWEDKEEDVAKQCDSELPVLEEEKSREILSDNSSPYNIIIEGDNYHSLYSLNFTHKGKIDVIYIDPPYNTGAKDWKYNNKYVDDTDPYRHSKWLSMMNKRLRLARNLLKPDGIICVTIDNYELPNLWLLMDKIFGEANNLGCVTIRNNPKGRMTKRKISQVHEYALFYGKSSSSIIKKLPVLPEDKSHSYIKDNNGEYFVKVNLRKQGVDSEAIKEDGSCRERYFPIYFDPFTNEISATERLAIEIYPIDNNGNKRIWRRNQEGVNELFKNGDLFCQKNRNSYQIYFKFRGGLDGEVPKSMWYDSMFSASEYGTSIVSEIIGREKFQFPKSLPAVKYSIKCCNDDKNAIILDFFAGSGTTGHAVMELNKEDGGNRQYILCTNNENNICKEVTYPRIKKVIEGYADKAGIPANVKYFRQTFVPNVINDQDKRELVNRSTELLCMANNTFEKIMKRTAKKEFAIFTNCTKQIAIIYDEESIEKCISKLNSLNSDLETIVYVFSYSHNYNEDDFMELKIKFSVKPIPEAILNVYRKISKGRKK